MPDLHSFHIPVLGLGFSIDTPVKVARFGISSVVSIMDDELIESMRQHHCEKTGRPYVAISKDDHDSRAKRTTAYLDLMHDIVSAQIEALKAQVFEDEDNELNKYFRLLPGDSALRSRYQLMKSLEPGNARSLLENELRESIVAGAVDVNIMVKIDKANKDKSGQLLPPEYSDASASLRGFAKSKLSSSVVLSAGYNPRLYSYIEHFPDFFPDEQEKLRKKVILKVSDYRSALVQGKILAKKGIWVSEFRIESGLNCGGHAFPTEGHLLGPILEEFKNNRAALADELYQLCTGAHERNGIPTFAEPRTLKITVQGGIGTAEEQNLLLKYYGIDRTGWGSPFLLVPEATNVDDNTLQQLATAKKDDYYLSHASPLGVPFNNFRPSSSERQRKERVEKNRPGSPCYKKFLVSDTEFTDEPICTASRKYQYLKINQLQQANLPPEDFEREYNKIIEKDCLCEGLAAPALLRANMSPSHNLSAVTICPGPNLAYFSGIFTLAEMAGHIYGRHNLLNLLHRPHMFINELHQYISYLKNAVTEEALNARRKKYLDGFRTNLLAGINYYKRLAQNIKIREQDLDLAEEKLLAICIPAAG